MTLTYERISSGGVINCKEHAIVLLQLVGSGFLQLSSSSSSRVRTTFYDKLKEDLPGFLGYPMPHGKVSDYIWNLFPDTSVQVKEAEFAALYKNSKCLIVFEDPRVPVFECSAVDGLYQALGAVDAYCVSWPSLEAIIAFDHEGYGPCRLVSHSLASGKAKNVRLSTGNNKPQFTFSRQLEPSELTAKRTDIAEALRRKQIYIPEHIFTGKSHADNLWNYLPESLDCAALLTDNGSLFPTYVGDCLMFNEQSNWNGIIAKSDLAIKKLPVDDLYLIDWPESQMLIAIPRPVLLSQADSPVTSSFVWL